MLIDLIFSNFQNALPILQLLSTQKILKNLNPTIVTRLVCIIHQYLRIYSCTYGAVQFDSFRNDVHIQTVSRGKNY